MTAVGKKSAVVLTGAKVIKTSKISLAPAVISNEGQNRKRSPTVINEGQIRKRSPTVINKGQNRKSNKTSHQGIPIVRPAKGYRVRVSNIAYDVKQVDILASFSLIGKVLSCYLKDGTAIVTFDAKKDAVSAIELYHQGDIHGRTIYVDFD